MRVYSSCGRFWRDFSLDSWKNITGIERMYFMCSTNRNDTFSSKRDVTSNYFQLNNVTLGSTPLCITSASRAICMHI